MMQDQMFMHIIGADLAHIQRDATGKQMTRFTNDVQFMRDATVKAFTGIARDLITVIVLAWVMIYTHWQMALIAMVVMPISIFPIIYIGKRLRRVSARTQENIGGVAAYLDDVLKASRQVKAYVTEEYEKRRAHQFFEMVSGNFLKAGKTRARTSREARARRMKTTTPRRAFAASALALALGWVTNDDDASASASASSREDADLARAVAGAREARARVAEARATLDGVDARDAPPLREIASLLNTDAVKRLEKNAVVIDAAVVREPLAEEERLAWRDVRDEEWLTTRSTTTLPMAKRPNDFLCAVFSCYNDPRAPPSTDALLSLRLTRDGVRMGARGDSRITAVGLAASLDDALEKLDALLALVDDV